MIFRNVSSPCRTPSRKKRVINIEQSLSGSAKSNRHEIESIPIRYTDAFKQERARREMSDLFKKKRICPIAPDALIPNSSCRTIFKPKIVKPVEPKAFQLRLDILENLQNKDNKQTDQDDDDWTEIADPDTSMKPSSAKKSKATLVSRQKFNNDPFSEDRIHNIYWTQDTMPDLFKRMQNEGWWKKPKEDRPNLRSMILYLNEILKVKQIDSYESACNYVVEIFRTYGLEPIFVNQILDILLDHLTIQNNDQLDICTIRTIAQFMIERKDIIVRLLEYAIKCSPNDIFRLETTNAIKFITDINNIDEIEHVFNFMSIVYDTPEDIFSLKTIIKNLESPKKVEIIPTEEINTDLHPLLKKISEERWFPRNTSPINFLTILRAIVNKISNTSKSLIKTLTTHLVEIDRQIGYSEEAFDLATSSLIELLGHTDADFRLIAASTLANLNKETKAIDLALLNSFVNDDRVLVRTECCDSLKKLTKITSDTVLKDCADDLNYLQTLPEENFSLRNYLNEKNRVPTPPITDTDSKSELESEPQPESVISIIVKESTTIPIEEESSVEIIQPSPPIPPPPPRSPTPPSNQPIPELTTSNEVQLPTRPASRQVSVTGSMSSSVTAIQPPIRVEINGRINAGSVANQPKSRTDQSTILTARQQKQSTSPTREQLSRKRSSLLPNNTNMWDSYEKQKEILDPPINLDHINLDENLVTDPLQALIDEHKQTVGFYRMNPNRRVLVPHKISMDNTLSDRTHIMIKQYTQSFHSMHLSDLSHNQHQLNEVESIQLLSSLVVRAVQVHRQYENFNPTSNTSNVMSALSVQPMQIHSNSKLPNLLAQRPTTKQFSRMQSNIQARAIREGINIQRAQHMEGIFSNLFKNNHESTKTTIISSQTSHHSSSRLIESTHAWLLVQLLKSQGVLNSEVYLHKIISAYPKFIPVLNAKIPSNLITIIWNDQIMRKIASIFTHKQEQYSAENTTVVNRSNTKQSNEDYVATSFDYSTIINRDEHKKKFLPILRGSKMNLPKHVLKFGFRDTESTDLSDGLNASQDESILKSKKRRVYMHMMMSTNENMFDRNETIKKQYRHVLKTGYQSTSYVPIITRPPMCQ